jgi:large subunit ribosomal protein L4
MARLAFRRAVSEKVAAGEVLVVDELGLAEPKTRALVEIMKRLGLDRGALIVVPSVDRNLALAARNLPAVELTTPGDLNTYQVLRYPKIVVSKPAMDVLEQRLKRAAGKA